jgi:hypothetical protein
MVSLDGNAISSDPSALPLISLDTRLGLLRRRRRLTFLKRSAAMGPVVVGLSLLLLAAYAGIAGLR